VLKPGRFTVPVYNVDTTDRIFGDTLHDEAVGHTLGRVVPFKLRLDASRAPRTARALPGIHFPRPSIRVARGVPMSAPADAIQNVLPDLTKIESADLVLGEVRKFSLGLGVLCDSLKLSNGVVLQLYGLYTAQGHYLVDYSIRYRRGAGSGRGSVDLMLDRFIEPPA
jgi:hypothetical protein